MHRICTALLFVAASLILASGCAGIRENGWFHHAAAPTQVDLSKGYRFERNGWTYVHIEGEPYERGYQFGHLVAPELKEIQRVMRHNTYQGCGQTWDFFIKEAHKQFAHKLDPEFAAETRGIAAGARAAGTEISWDEVLAWNGFMELLWYWWSAQDKAKLITPDQEHCSAFIATGTTSTLGGRVVMAHNTWFGYSEGQFFNVILDVKPAHGHRILMQSAPGMIHSGTDFAVTDAGLTVTETTISGMETHDALKTPEFHRLRKALQYADNLDQFASIMIKDNNGSYANSWLVSDVRTGEVMRLELGLKLHQIERTKAGYYIGFNGATDPRIRHMEGKSYNNEDIRKSVGSRMVRLTQLMERNAGKIDTAIGQEILADHYDVYLKKDNPGARTIDGHYELDPLDFGNADGAPFGPWGAIDGKVIDTDLAKKMSFWARWGCSCGRPFDAKAYLKDHIQWRVLDGYLKDRPTQPWTLFTIDDHPAK